MAAFILTQVKVERYRRCRLPASRFSQRPLTAELPSLDEKDIAVSLKSKKIDVKVVYPFNADNLPISPSTLDEMLGFFEDGAVHGKQIGRTSSPRRRCRA